MASAVVALVVAVGSFIEIAEAATSALQITAISPTSITVNTATTITLTGCSGTGNDFVKFVGSGTTCSGDLSTDGTASAISASCVVTAVTFGVTDTDAKLCYCNDGQADSVEETSVAEYLDVIAATSGSRVTVLTPSSISESTATAVTLTGGNSATDTIGWAVPSAACGTVTPSTVTGAVSNPVVSVNLPGTGAYTLCYRDSGGSDSVAQLTITVVTATPSNRITSINPSSILPSTATSILFTGGNNAADKYSWSAVNAADCTTTTPATSMGGLNPTVSATLTSGTYKLCYRDNGGSDSVSQTSVTLSVQAPVTGNDPITYFGDEKREFWLPVGRLTPVLYGREITMFAETFAGNPHEQWFKRIVVTSAGGFKLVDVVIKEDIGKFARRNGTRLPRDIFETLDVTLGSESAPLANLPASDSYFHRMGVHIGVKKMSEMRQGGPPVISQRTIGGANREVVLIACPSVQFLIAASPAIEYFGAFAHLAVKYAHLDIVILEMRDRASLRGLLPELWGFRPLSNRTKAFMIPPEKRGELQLPTSEIVL